VEQPHPKTSNDGNSMWHSTTHLVVGQFPGAPAIDWIAVLLPYYIPTSLVGVCALPLSRTRSLTGQRFGVEPLL
jgi:hypothetical protein